MLSIDFNAVLPEALLQMVGARQFVEAVLDDVAAASRAKWIRLAQQELHSSKRDYIDSIQDVESSGQLERTIRLVGWLAHAVETGLSPFDLRETLLGAGKGRTSKDGRRYRPIPFRHSTPGSRGQAGPQMGSAYGPRGDQSRALTGGMTAGAASELGRAVYGLAKRLQGGATLGHGSPKRTYVFQATAKASSGKVAGQLIRVPKLATHHSTDIYAGMRKVTKQYGKRKQSHYVTFRTISEGGQGWIHPGITARRLTPRVADYAREQLPKIMGMAIKRALGGTGVTT